MLHTRTGVTGTASRGRKIERTENFNTQYLILIDFGLQNTVEVGFNSEILLFKS